MVLLIDSIAKIFLLAIYVFVNVVWIISLTKWYGKKPCVPEDCETCPYKSTDCVPNGVAIKSKERNNE